MATIAIPATGLRLPTFWEAVESLEPETFAAQYVDPFLLQLASLDESQMLHEVHARGDSGPTIDVSADMLGLRLLPWDETCLLTLAKRQDQFPEQITIGRSSSNDVVIPSPLVSKIHATVQQEEEEWILTDAGSRNGTIVGGRAVEPDTPVPLEFGGEVVLGDARFLFVLPFFFHHAVKTLLPRESSPE